MSRAKIVVVGSSNIDMVVKTESMPIGGETVLGGDFAMVPGGKGANQAVCAAKLGADVTLVANIGNDIFGETSLNNFKNVGINTEYITRDSTISSGVALIVVDAKAENAIVVAPGANSTLTPADVDHAKDVIADADALILQFETPLESVFHAIDLARSLGVKVVLNPAPMRAVPKEILSKVNVLILNQHEAAELLGKAGQGASIDAESSAAELKKLGVECVVITLGSRGAFVASGDVAEYIQPIRVNAVDTTAAGDAFTGSFACGLAEGKTPIEAAQFATRVAAITVTRMGAQPSMPSRKEAESYNFA